MKQLRTISILIITVCLMAISAFAGENEIQISAEVSSASIPFEGKDTLIVRLSWRGEPFQYQINDFPMPELEKFRVLGSSSSVSSASDSGQVGTEITTRTYSYILEPTDYGSGVIKPLDLTATNKINGEEHQLQTGKLTVEIAKPVYKEEKKPGSVWPMIIIIVVSLGVLAAVVVIVIKRRRKSDEPDTSHQQYLDALETVKKETVADRKLFFSRLYRVLLQYLENEYNLDVSGKTGEEVISIVHGLDNEEVKTTYIAWLERLQKEKYRPDAPAAGEVENMYKAVYSFFEKRISQK